MATAGWTDKQEREYAAMNWKVNHDLVQKIVTRGANMPGLEWELCKELSVYATCGPRPEITNVMIKWVNEVVMDALRVIEERQFKKLQQEMAWSLLQTAHFPYEESDDEIDYSWVDHAVDDVTAFPDDVMSDD